MRIDGRLDDACWAPARSIGRLYGAGGEETGGEPTEVYVARDAGSLFLGIRMPNGNTRRGLYSLRPPTAIPTWGALQRLVVARFVGLAGIIHRRS